MAALRTSVLLVLLLAALAFLQYHLWFESGGISDMLHLKKTLVEQTRQNEVLKKENDDLVTQIQRIQKSEDAAEARARSELGMVKQGETFYQVVK